MNQREVRDILSSALAVGEKLADLREKRETEIEAFAAVYEPITFVKTDDFASGCVTTGVSTISCANFSYAHPQSSYNNIVHELGHVFNNILNGNANDFGWKYASPEIRNSILKPDGRIDWQQNKLYDPLDTYTTGGEMLGDMFVAWVFDEWNDNPLNTDLVNDANEDMNNTMYSWTINK